MIYLDDNNKVSIKKNKVKSYVQYSGIKKKKGFKQTKTNIDWSEYVSTLVTLVVLNTAAIQLAGR
jgi:hypothetical protein